MLAIQAGMDLLLMPSDLEGRWTACWRRWSREH